MSKELVFLFPLRECDPSLPLPSSTLFCLLKPFSHLSFDTLIPVSIFPASQLQTFTFHPSCPLASIISSFYLLLISFSLLFHTVSPPSPPLHAPPVIKAPGPLMVGKAHGLSWSASGFTVSSSANVIRAICAHTHTHTHI